MTATPAGVNEDAFQTWQINLATTGGTPHAERRARVALACQRCKSRKQKCDGVRPSCSKCRARGATCEYILPSKYMPFGKARYVKALERRVAELESYLTKEGVREVALDHWQGLPSPGAAASSAAADHPRRGSSEAARQAASAAAAAATDAASSSSDDATEAGGEPRMGVSSMIAILRDLSLDANGGYMGATAHITMGRLVGSMVKGKNSARVSSKISSVKAHLPPSSSSSSSSHARGPAAAASSSAGFAPAPAASTDEDEDEDMDGPGDAGATAGTSAFRRIPAHHADRMLAGYMTHTSTAFPILHSPTIRDLHARRATVADVYEVCLLHLIYAIGGRFLETTGEPAGCFFPERHHTAALKRLDEILQFHDLRSVQTLMLLAIYCLRAPQGPGAWTYVGLAMRIAIDLGLHRRTAAMHRPSLENELKKRLFWSCYNLDRQVSIPLGRPFAISDRDIDVPLPLEIDEAVVDVPLVVEAAAAAAAAAAAGGAGVTAAAVSAAAATATSADGSTTTTTPTATAATARPLPPPSTTLSPFVHLTKLRIIESSIQQNVYRVDSGDDVSDADIDAFLDKLEDWRRTIPRTGRGGYEFGSGPQDERYMVYYYACMRLLLYPQVSRPHVQPRYLKQCAEACGGVCRTYKRLHQHMSVGYSLMGLQSVFMAGLTLVYCTWVDPTLVFNSTTNNDIYACSIVLFVITERWPGARKYRDAFDVIKQNVIDAIADGKHRAPRQTVVQLKTELQSTLHNLQGDEDQQDECSRILTDMAGEKIAMEQGSLLLNPRYPQLGAGAGAGAGPASGSGSGPGSGPGTELGLGPGPGPGGSGQGQQQGAEAADDWAGYEADAGKGELWQNQQPSSLFTDDLDMGSWSNEFSESGEWLMYY